jgi:hypothetical protein
MKEHEERIWGTLRNMRIALGRGHERTMKENIKWGNP